MKKVEEIQVRYIKNFYKLWHFFSTDKDGNIVETNTYYLANRFLDGEEDAKGWDAYYDESITECYLCGKEFSGDSQGLYSKVRDHCHFTGKFRGCRVPKMTPIFFPNLNYDKNLFIRDMAKDLGMDFDTNVIAKSTEKFVSFSKGVNVFDDVIIEGKPTDWIWELRYLDSCSFFMFYSLDELVKNLKAAGKHKFKEIKRWIDSIDVSKKHYAFDLMTRKGEYPYSYVKNFDVFNETEVPPKSAFKNDLTGKKLSKKDYKRILGCMMFLKLKHLLNTQSCI